MVRLAQAILLLLVTAFVTCCSDGPQAENVYGSYEVIIISVVERRKVTAIKCVRKITDLGLNESRDLVDFAPSLVKKDVSKKEADRIAAALREAHMTVEVRKRQ